MGPQLHVKIYKLTELTACIRLQVRQHEHFCSYVLVHVDLIRLQCRFLLRYVWIVSVNLKFLYLCFNICGCSEMTHSRSIEHTALNSLQHHCVGVRVAGGSRAGNLSCRDLNNPQTPRGEQGCSQPRGIQWLRGVLSSLLLWRPIRRPRLRTSVR